MANQKKNKNNTKNNPAGATARNLEVEADVLFQRIFDKWYAFSVVDDDLLMSEVSEEEVQKRVVKKTSKYAA